MKEDNGQGDPAELHDRELQECKMTQCMIDITLKQLDGLRQCKTTEEIIKNEIKESESKLVKLFGKQLVVMAKLKRELIPDELKGYPKVEQWLHIVGLNQQLVKGVQSRCFSMETLLGMSEMEVSNLMKRYNATEEEAVRLNGALRCLRLLTESQLKPDAPEISEEELHWSNYKSVTSGSPHNNIGNSPNSQHLRPSPSSTSSLPPDTYLNTASPQSPASPPTPPFSTPTSPLPYPSPAEQRRRFTPPSTPPTVKPSKGKFPTTPPPGRKNKLYPGLNPLIKSSSHESQLSGKVNQDGGDSAKVSKKKPDPLPLSPAGNSELDLVYNRKRSDGHSGQSSPLISSPKRSPPYTHSDQFSLSDIADVHPNKKNHLVVPVSPNTPNRSMMHAISHRFKTKLVMGNCDWCQKYVLGGKVCKYCKLKFHRDCAAKAAPACGLPNELVDVFLVTMRQEGSPGPGRRPTNPHHGDIPHVSSVPFLHAQDSGSTTSSCTSSTPSSPAQFINALSSSAQPSPVMQGHTTQFPYPDITTVSYGSDTTSGYSGSRGGYLSGSQSLSDRAEVVNTNTSNDSDRSDKTLVDTGSSGEKSGVLDRVDSQESTEDGPGQKWERVNSISVTLKEWDIPYEELSLDEKKGNGRFGEVWKGSWHGDVAIKLINIDPVPDNNQDHQLRAFKLEVSMLRKTRHENLVLFMGACMKPPKCAIVTSLCKGHTLYHHIHVFRERLPMNKTINIASQIAQGMGYLHAKEIVHKDLKSKNIFIENGKVVITDFGLFSVTKLCRANKKSNVLHIPPGWLCYLAPEIVENLQPGNQNQMDLPFTKSSDVYAFGTVWYEIFTSEWPFKNQPPEVIIWQVGKGMKQSLGSLQASKDIKDILFSCWSFKSSDRTNFSSLLKTLTNLPKKRLARSPSHPVHLSRSAESVF